MPTIEHRTRQSRFQEILASARRAHRAFSSRTCVCCGATFVPHMRSLRVDPRCPGCALRLHHVYAEDAELGCGD